MASVKDILKKNKTKSDFVPTRRRAWDFVPDKNFSVEGNNEQNNIQGQPLNKSLNSNQARKDETALNDSDESHENRSDGKYSVIDPNFSSSVSEHEKSTSSIESLESTCATTDKLPNMSDNNVSRPIKFSSSQAELRQESGDLSQAVLHHEKNKLIQEKTATKVTRNSHKTDTKLIQKSHKSKTKPTQNQPKTLTNSSQTSHKTVTKTDTESEFLLLKEYKRITGIQKILLHTIYENIASTGQNISEYLDIKTLANVAEVNKNSIKTSLKRLYDKGILIRADEKHGRGGWVQFELPQLIYREIHTELKKVRINNKTNTETNTSTIYSSSNINTTTNLPADWKQINFEALNQIHFSQTQLQQLVDRTTPEIVQQSINHFAYALDNNPKVKDHPNPLNLLMGVLRKGGAWTECNYRSPQEIAMQKILEAKKAEKERMELLEKEAYSLAYENWKGSLSESDINNIAPPKQGRADIMPQGAKLSLYFKENIWPKIKKDYMA